MINISILGATGYTGFELVKLLLRHNHVNIRHVTGDSTVGKIYSDIYPSLSGTFDNVLIPTDPEKVAQESDAVFLCLPHGASMDAVAATIAKGKIAIDLSADYRLQDADLYESTYKIKHKYTDLLSKSVYGLGEIYTDELKKAELIAVPGCYPSSVLLPLIPLLRDELLDTDFIVADSKSGVSGAGKKATEATHFCEVNEDFRPYNIFAHRHKPEIDHIIHRTAGKITDVLFTPHLIPATRGMISTIYAKSNVGADEIVNSWQKAYNGRRLVRLKQNVPAVKHVANTPYIDMAAYANGDKVVIVSAIDNLMKGASSQAVQCFNIRMGFNEWEGLL